MTKKTSALASASTMLPLAIALLHTAVTAPPKGGGAPAAPTTVQAVPCGEGVEDFQACHSAYPTGCSASGKYDPYLNLMKNQISWPSMEQKKFFTTADDYTQLETQLEDLPGDGLQPGNHGDYLAQLSDMGEGKIHGLIGYLYDIKVEGKESSNCQLEDSADHANVDFHIFIGFDPDVAARIRDKKLTAEDKAGLKANAVIVEMTPQCCGPDGRIWTADEVQAVKGMKVKVLGQLMVDNEHDVPGQNCGRSDHTKNCWRASVWELHPVTGFEVCDSGTCDQTSAGWRPLAGN